MKQEKTQSQKTPQYVFFDLDRTILNGDAFVYVTRQAIKENIFTCKDYCVMGALLLNEIFSQIVAPKLFARGFILYRNKPKKQIDAIIDHTKEKLIGSLYPDAVRLIKEYKKKGAKVYIVTGTFERAAQIICKHLQLDGSFGTHLKTYTKNRTEFLSGKTGGYVRGKTKAAVIKKHFSQKVIQNGIGYSDSIIDLPFLKLFPQQVVVNPDIRLRIISAIKGWKRITFTIQQSQK